MTPVIEFNAVDFRYRHAPILDDVGFQIEAGEFLGIVGPNGSGKTTVLKLILGLLKPDAGNVTVLGGTPHEARHHLGYVPQFAGFNRDFPITVMQAVLMGRLGLGWRLGRYHKADYAAARKAMDELGITELKDAAIGSLSGGELQRALIARALVCDPEILLLDEPTANVDARAEISLFEQLKSLGRNKTVLVVSHDVGFISHYVSRVACVNRSVVCHPTAEVTADTIEALYGAPQRHVHGTSHRHDPIV